MQRRNKLGCNSVSGVNNFLSFIKHNLFSLGDDEEDVHATVVVIVNYQGDKNEDSKAHICDEIFHAVDLFMVPQKAINLRLLLLPGSCDLRFQCSSLHHCSSFCEIKGSEDTVNLGSNYLLGKYSNCDQCLDLCLPLWLSRGWSRIFPMQKQRMRRVDLIVEGADANRIMLL